MIKEHWDKMNRMYDEVQAFDKKQVMEAFYWMILGDGSIEQKLRGNYNLSVSHKTASHDYVVWKSWIIERVTSCSIKEQVISGGGGFGSGTHEMVRLRSSAHPWFTKVWDRLYGTIGRKCIDPYALALLGPIGLAIIYQDDGSLNITHRKKDNRPNPWVERNLLIHELCFSKLELEAFAKTVVDRFGIIFRINRCDGKGLGYRLRLRSSDIDKFIEIIEPYVVPSMFYKIGRGSNHVK